MRLQCGTSEIFDGDRGTSVLLCHERSEILRGFDHRSRRVEPNAIDEGVKRDKIVEILVLRFLRDCVDVKFGTEANELRVQVLPLG